uniref:PDZ domain-containing protein n=1 Tax=Ciona savignyi TaxID=51511 RepID=H2Y5A9_CIOSA
MPFSNIFRKKKSKTAQPNLYENLPQNDQKSLISSSPETSKPKLVFHAQLAHGSPTVKIEGFSNVRELYSKLADAFQISVIQIIFCTLNTHKCDMDRLLGGQIGLDDFIFVHIKGEKKVVTVEKSEAALGLTITDNGAGYAFVKRIRTDSVVDKIGGINVGDHIESIDDVTMVGNRHFQVAKLLKEIPLNTIFKISLVNSQKGFDQIAPWSRKDGTSLQQHRNRKVNSSTSVQ